MTEDSLHTERERVRATGAGEIRETVPELERRISDSTETKGATDVSNRLNSPADYSSHNERGVEYVGRGQNITPGSNVNLHMWYGSDGTLPVAATVTIFAVRFLPRGGVR